MRFDEQVSGAAVGPFSRMVGELGRTPPAPPPRAAIGGDDPLYSAIQADMHAELRRARRVAGAAWTLAVLLGAAIVAGGWITLKRQSALQQERAALSVQLVSAEATVERLTDAADRKRADLASIRRETAAATQALAVADAESQRLRLELDQLRRRLADTEQREAQARAKWAYAEGERDALYTQVDAMILRLEAALQNAERRPTPTTPEPPSDLFSPELPDGQAALPPTDLP